jgi:hypothetical protein
MVFLNLSECRGVFADGLGLTIIPTRGRIENPVNEGINTSPGFFHDLMQ